MEEKMKKCGQVSPERAKVWTEKSPKYHYDHHYNHQQRQPRPRHNGKVPVIHNGKVPVIYYLCRNRQLEHPHFMEVSLSSPDGLFMTDVIERLDVLRGRGMASTYSWSCKRIYKNGFVWHDLCDEDLLLPAHGNEYVLKGSELFEVPSSGHCNPAGNAILQNVKALPKPPSSRSQEESSSSSSLNGRTAKSSLDDELSPPIHRPCSSVMSPDSSKGRNSSWNGSLSLTEYKVYKSDNLADASTQTEENASRAVGIQDTCTRGVSTDVQLLEPECGDTRKTHNHNPQVKENSEICQNLVSPPPSTSCASSSCGRTDTLQSLIRADARKLNSFRILEEEEFRMPSGMKLKATNMLMQIISCGSVSVKDHSFGLIPTYKPRFSHSKFPSPLFSTSFMLGEVDCHAENRSPIGMSVEDKEYFSGSLIEKSMPKGVPTLKRSSSYNADSTSKQFDSIEDEEKSSSIHSKCIPRSVMASLSRQPRSESMRSPLSEGPRISSYRVESSRTMTPGTPNCGSMRFTEPFSGKKQVAKLDSPRNDKENVIQIEERLASGARVIIQSKVCPDSEGNS